jgi:DNA-binding transcriptional MerR regulator
LTASRSIGEILDDLRGDFPDISVSKIRFLESQGLITPERSPSGYRQFSDTDLELLRWILLQQRDHYLPLKVIRRRLKDGEGPGPDGAVGAAGDVPVEAPAPARVAAATMAVEEARLTLPDPPTPAEDDVWLVSDGPDPASAAPAPGAAPRAALPADELWPPDPDIRYSRNDIRQQTGLDEKSMTELESFGLLPAAGPEGYGPEALRIAGIASGFFAYGVEARHLRMYKTSAEREAAFLGQVVMPMVNAKDPGAASRAADALTELARLGAALRLSMLRVGLGPKPRGLGGVPPTEAAGAARDGGG